MTAWPELTTVARRHVGDDVRVASDASGGLHGYQLAIVHHVLSHFADRPGIVVAERTGRGKSQIAMTAIGALARAKSEATGEPLRVGLLAPNANVLNNWIKDGGLFHRAFDPRWDGTYDDTYIWTTQAIEWDVRSPLWASKGPWFERPEKPLFTVYADHYGHGITHRFAQWSKDPEARGAQARTLIDDLTAAQLDLLIIDEAHQLKSGRSNRAKAIETLFGRADSPISVARVMLLTATPFQLRAAPELARLVKILRYPSSNGGTDFPPTLLTRTSGAALQRLFERYERALSRWLMLKLANLNAEQSREKALAAKLEVESVLRPLIVRTDDPREHVLTRYGHPDPMKASLVPDASKGLETTDAIERLLFLAWDGSIASRTTFVASEQQTLSSSAAALRRRRDEGVKLSALEQARRPLAPLAVQQALVHLANALADQVKPDHIKVRATTHAVTERSKDAKGRKPTVVFAERNATLKLLADEMRSQAPDTVVRVLDGGTDHKTREAIIAGFAQREDHDPVHVVLASQVAEMGLDIDGPVDKDDIWLIHHDFPWNPAMVDQRNGRVTRSAKRQKLQDVFISYPFIRDTVDERIFKRMLLRQAIAELLLGTDDVSRALRLAEQGSLDETSLSMIPRGALRELTPDLSPQPDEHPREPALDTPPIADEVRPPWCSLDLMAVAVARTSGGDTTDELSESLQRVVADNAFLTWSQDNVHYVRVDLTGRKQTVALEVVGDTVEAVSIADSEMPDERVLRALNTNFAPGIAGLMLYEDPDGATWLLARAANLLETMSDGELHRLIVETARRADEWEAQFHEEDRW